MHSQCLDWNFFKGWKIHISWKMRVNTLEVQRKVSSALTELINCYAFVRPSFIGSTIENFTLQAKNTFTLLDAAKFQSAKINRIRSL